MAPFWVRCSNSWSSAIPAIMAHLLGFSIEGLAGRKDAYARTLDRHRNVFYGPNGCGKTSLLRILHSALSDDASLVSDVPFTHAEVDFYSARFRGSFKRTYSKPLQASVGAFDEASAIQGVLSSNTVFGTFGPSKRGNWKTESLTKQQGPGPRGLLCTYLPTYRIVPQSAARSWITTYESQSVISAAEIERQFAHELQELWKTYNATLLQDVKSTQEAGLAAVLKSVLTPGKRGKKLGGPLPDSREAYRRMKAFLDRQGKPELLPSETVFERRYATQPVLHAVVSDLRSIEDKIEKTLAPRRQFEQLVSDLYSGGKTVTFGPAEITVKLTGGASITIESLSSGEKQLMMLLLQALNTKGNTMLVDEPELSLHIDWQRRLLGALSLLSARTQVIVATHSPDITSDTPDEQLHRMP